MNWVKYITILIILIIIAIAVIKSGKRDFKIEANKLVELLGGKKKYYYNNSTNHCASFNRNFMLWVL